MKNQVRFYFVASIGLIFLLFIEPQREDAHASTFDFDKVIRTLKSVVKAAINGSIDEIGYRLLGPTVWRIVKKVSEPALNEFFTDNKLHPEKITRLMSSLDNNTKLRQNMRQRFEALSLDERNSLLSKLDEIEEQLIRLESLTRETNLGVKEIKRLLLSILDSPNTTGRSSTVPPKDLSRFDVNDSLLTIFYPSNIRPPRKSGDKWYVGARFEQRNLNSIFDKKQPVIIIKVLGALNKSASWNIIKVKLAIFKQKYTKKCDKNFEGILVQELLMEERTVLFVGRCKNLILPNYYVAVRIFYSNGALIQISALIGSDKMWKEYKVSLLNSMRLTKFRGTCGFYGTACCIPSGKFACEPALTCKKKKCLPPLN